MEEERQEKDIKEEEGEGRERERQDRDVRGLWGIGNNWREEKGKVSAGKRTERKRMKIRISR